MKMTLSDVGNLLRFNNKRLPSQIKGEILGKLPIEVTFEGEVVFKIVPKNWRNPMFPIH